MSVSEEAAVVEGVPTVIRLRDEAKTVILAGGKAFSVRRVVLGGRVAVEIDGLEIVGFGEDRPNRQEGEHS